MVNILSAFQLWGGMGGMGGLVVRALAFHRCGPGSIPARVIRELSLFNVLFFLMPQGFFSGFSSFPPSSKINTVSQV